MRALQASVSKSEKINQIKESDVLSADRSSDLSKVIHHFVTSPKAIAKPTRAITLIGRAIAFHKHKRMDAKTYFTIWANKIQDRHQEINYTAQNSYVIY